MDLLGENKKAKRTPQQKLVLRLLITSIVLFVITIGLIAYITLTKSKTQVNVKWKVKNQEVIPTQEFMMNTENGEHYVELKELAGLLNYTYYNGAYLEFSENKEKCYIDNEREIIGFEKNSKKIYKVKDEGAYQYFEMNNEIVDYNQKLYINISDLPLALNVVINNGNIYTVDDFAEIYNTQFKNAKSDWTVDKENSNLKALAYNLIVVNKDSKKGIINNRYEEIVGAKYDAIYFIELSKDFIVSSNDKYGIIKSSGETRVKLVYDEIRVLSYSPLVYSTKKDGKYGIIDENGDIVANNEFVKIGYSENKQKTPNIVNTVVIPKLIEKTGETIVVAKDEGYGLIDISKKQLIIECKFDGIYGIKEGEVIKYYIKQGEREYNLQDYLEVI